MGITEILVCALSAIVILLYQSLKQLVKICNQLSDTIKNYREDKEKKNTDNENVYMADEKYDEDKDYTDSFAKWVKENKDSHCVYCSSSCKLLRPAIGFSMKDNHLHYCVDFEGYMKSYYGCLPNEESVCKFRFRILFGVDVCGIDGMKKDVKLPYSLVKASQDSYRDAIDDIYYYKGRHTVTLELYLDTSEFEKYKPLLYSGRKLGANVSFDIDVSKIKMNGDIIVDNYTDFIGKLSSFGLFVVE